MLYSIQLLRGLAALLVVCTHSIFATISYGNNNSILSSFYNFSEFGAVGVDIFFVISGFIIVYVTQNNNKKFNIFIKERLIRVVPLYWFFLSIMACALIFFPSAFVNNEFILSHAIYSFLFLPAYKFDGSISPLLGVGWTLNYEVFFYVIFSFSLYISSWKKRFFLVSSIFIMLSCFGIVYQNENPIIYVFTRSLLIEFVFGMLVAYLFFESKFLSKKLATSVLVLSIFLLSLSVIYGVPDKFDTIKFIVWGIPAFFLVYSLLCLEIHGLKFNNLLIFLGKISYSLYLSHYFTVRLLSKLFEKLGGFSIVGHDDIIVLVLMFFSIIVGYLTFRFIEEPLTKYLNCRFIKGKSVVTI